MANNPLIELEDHGQSVWLDYISRSLLESGELSLLIKNDHLKGVTSNPSIFEKAIAKTNDYHQVMLEVSRKETLSAKDTYENLAVKDIRGACDLLRPIYEKTKGTDGFACLEVSPHLAYDTLASIEEGRRLWHLVDRPNLMVKIPGTAEGMPAIRTLIGEGINVNVTLLFSLASYQNAAEAYLLGLKDRAEKGFPIDSVQSVASFFISRIDSKVDQELERVMKEAEPAQKQIAESLIGTIAIVNAKVAYAQFLEIYQSDLAKSLRRMGAHPQRLLWASTSTKNPKLSDVLYVESLIGAQTVNTLPLETLIAFRDHGKVASTLASNLQNAEEIIDSLSGLGLDFDAICEELQVDGVKLFTKAFDQLLTAVDQKLLELKIQK